MPSKLHFELYKDSKGEWRWRLVAKNNRIIATSGEGYKRKGDCIKGIDITTSAVPGIVPIVAVS